MNLEIGASNAGLLEKNRLYLMAAYGRNKRNGSHLRPDLQVASWFNNRC